MWGRGEEGGWVIPPTSPLNSLNATPASTLPSCHPCYLLLITCQPLTLTSHSSPSAHIPHPHLTLLTLTSHSSPSPHIPHPHPSLTLTITSHSSPFHSAACPCLRKQSQDLLTAGGKVSYEDAAIIITCYLRAIPDPHGSSCDLITSPDPSSIFTCTCSRGRSRKFGREGGGGTNY